MKIKYIDIVSINELTVNYLPSIRYCSGKSIIVKQINEKSRVCNNIFLYFTGISNPEGFAIDWMSGNMYFSSFGGGKASISVAKLNGAYRTEILSTGMIKPNSLVVFPQEGYVNRFFWGGGGI